MPRVKIGPALPDQKSLDVEIARLRDLNIGDLQSRWRTVFRQRPPLTYRAISCFVFLPTGFRPIVSAIWMARADVSLTVQDHLKTPESERSDSNRLTADVRPGTMLAREWNGRMHRVAVLADGFAWNGKTYPSLSKIALAITGTRWNGPRFFGLRDKPSKEVQG